MTVIGREGERAREMRRGKIEHRGIEASSQSETAVTVDPTQVALGWGRVTSNAACTIRYLDAAQPA
jgi:hypothetical protein